MCWLSMSYLLPIFSSLFPFFPFQSDRGLTVNGTISKRSSSSSGEYWLLHEPVHCAGVNVSWFRESIGNISRFKESIGNVSWTWAIIVVQGLKLSYYLWRMWLENWLRQCCRLGPCNIFVFCRSTKAHSCRVMKRYNRVVLCWCVVAAVQNFWM